jgi:signal transduction histidine kinase
MHDSPLNPPRWRLAMLADELTGPLRQLRIAMRAQEALIVYAPHRSTTRVIASDPHTESAFLPEEPVHMAVRWRKAPWTEQRLRVTSAMRLLAVDFDRALALPFADSRGRGLVILGSAAPVDDAALATVQRFAREIDAQRSRIDQTRHRDIDRAYRVVARAATSDLSLERVFDITLAAARDLLDGDVAYLSLPVDDDYFAFTRTLGIQTGRFRDLRVGLGEGLGGAARETGHPVRSLNYQTDSNLRSAPREETRSEGLYSALAAPVHDHGNVEAVLYVASRRPRAYSEDDERVLADFANATMLGLDRSDLDESRQEMVREQERARLAQTLHDDLVRRLTQIGFAAEELKHQPMGVNESQVATISASVNECMSIVRGELRILLQDARNQDSTLNAVAERIFKVPALSGMRRIADFATGGMGSVAHLRVPTDIADAMCAVGQEAVFNAENHSKGSQCQVSFDVQPGKCVMSISDNGTTFPGESPGSGHYGLDFIKREVRKVGGDVAFLPSASGGVDVRASFPTDTWQKEQHD